MSPSPGTASLAQPQSRGSRDGAGERGHALLPWERRGQLPKGRGWKGQCVPGREQSCGSVPAAAAFLLLPWLGKSLSWLPPPRLLTQAAQGTCWHSSPPRAPIPRAPVFIWSLWCLGRCERQRRRLCPAGALGSPTPGSAAPAPGSFCKGQCQQCWATLPALGSADREELRVLFSCQGLAELVLSSPVREGCQPARPASASLNPFPGSWVSQPSSPCAPSL